MKFFDREKPKIGLALGSGAARGLAHIGVLKALKEKNIFVDMIAGSSMGALVGACYAKNGEITDIEEIVIKEGSVIEAVRASISIPAIFMPVKLNSRFLIDGGIVNPVPVNVVKDMGATFVIACNVIQKLQGRRPVGFTKRQKSLLPISKTQIKNTALAALNNKIDKLLLENKDKIENFQKFINGFKEKFYRRDQKVDPNTPSIFDAIIKAIYAMEYEIAKSKIKEADIIITPDTGYIASLEFYRGRESILEGYKAAKGTLSKKNLLLPTK